MPFVEVTTSTQNSSQDSEGYMRVVRTFKVWGVSPATFWKAKTSIPHRDANATPSVADRMPDYGHVFTTTRNPFGVEDTDGVLLDVVLYDFQARQESAITFYVDAIYTNDPRAAPLGQNYTSTQQITLAPIPFVREIQVVTEGQSGTSSTTPISYDEAVYSAPMAVERISHTVSVKRSQLRDVERAVEQQAGTLHTIPVKRYACRFEGADINMRGPQWLDVRYHWTWESGVPAHGESMWTKALYENGSAPQGAVTFRAPPNTTSSIVGMNTGSTKFLLPPFHTIDMGWDIHGSDLIRQPVWYYRLNLKEPGAGSFVPGWQGLPGAQNFIWGNGT